MDRQKPSNVDKDLISLIDFASLFLCGGNTKPSTTSHTTAEKGNNDVIQKQQGKKESDVFGLCFASGRNMEGIASLSQFIQSQVGNQTHWAQSEIPCDLSLKALTSFIKDQTDQLLPGPCSLPFLNKKLPLSEAPQQSSDAISDASIQVKDNLAPSSSYSSSSNTALPKQSLPLVNSPGPSLPSKTPPPSLSCNLLETSSSPVMENDDVLNLFALSYSLLDEEDESEVSGGEGGTGKAVPEMKEDLKHDLPSPSATDKKTEDKKQTKEPVKSEPSKGKQDREKDDQSNDVVVFKPYMLPFISDNPEENKDNEDPGWCYLRSLETDEERYQQTRKLWKSVVVPDQNVNLTYYGYLRCKRNKSVSTTKEEVRCDSKDDVGRESYKRRREESEDRGLPAGKRLRFCDVSFSIERFERRMKQVAEECISNLRERSLSCAEASKMKDTAIEKIDQLEMACMEVDTLHRFYRGLPDQELSLAQAEVEKQQDEVDKLIACFKNVYGWDGKIFFP